MLPHPQAPVEEPQPQPRKGIRVDPTKYTKVPNFIYNPLLWNPLLKGGRKPSADTVLVYLWCLDKVTSVYDDEKLGVPIGVVMFGREIPFTLIGDKDNLEISWSTVQRSMKHLVAVGLIRRTQDRATSPYRYEVINCWTFKAAETKKSINTTPEQRQQIIDDQRKKHHLVPEFDINGDDDELT
jgi:hypothetical protein